MILITKKLADNSWSLDGEIDSEIVELRIGIIQRSKEIDFNDLNFGFKLYKQDKVIQYDMFPPANVTYISTDQDYLISTYLNCQPNKKYSLNVWVEENGEFSSYDYSFETPIPIKPYPSWIWNGNVWEAPVSMPTDNKMYIWKEDELKWIEPPPCPSSDPENQVWNPIELRWEQIPDYEVH